MTKPQYKILRNQPEEESYGQYVYSYDLETFWEETGISTPFKEDDLYSIITKQRNSTSYETVILVMKFIILMRLYGVLYKHNYLTKQVIFLVIGDQYLIFLLEIH